MATTTELTPNEYMVFEADQVLTNDHLNKLFNYLDQQNRWTRNKLIGIGIVCGLNIVQHTGVIEITKGCGVTSQGYLIILDKAKQYTYYLPYTGVDQPKDLPFTYPGNLPFFKPFNANKTIFSLLTDDDFTALEADAKKDAQTLSSANANNVLDDYAVVLFLEASELDLKNCDAFDCNNKGEKMTLNPRALLVKKTELPVLQKSLPVIPVNINIGTIKPPVLTTGISGIKPLMKTTLFKGKTAAAKPAVTNIQSNLSTGFTGFTPFPLLPIFSIKPPDISLKRFNVPYTDLKTTDDVINAFAKLVDDATLTMVSKAFNYSYSHYKDVLNDDATGFPTLLNDLKAQRDTILKNNPVFIQYFYDFIDDLTKAYYEFRAKVSLLLSACCPDENLFPLHLVLGAATANTKDFTKDAYRTYFIYSPLFAKQENAISETQFLFRRMQILVSEFVTILPDTRQAAAIQILPGLYKQAPLSQRTIPYYYTVNESGNELYKYWNYYKTIRNDQASNISYNSNLYTGDLAVQNPLLYDIEKYNFFRIEGHIGLNYQTALANILQQRKSYNLPFDVVAISADQLPAGGALPQCNMQDLDTNFKLLVSEFSCKVHTPFCFITKLPYPPPSSTTVAGTVTNTGGLTVGTVNVANAGIASNIALAADTPKLSTMATTTPMSFSTFRLQTAATEALNINASLFPIFQIGYRKGDFMRKYCAPNARTIGSVYLSSLSSTGVFTNPVQLTTQNASLLSYYRLFDYIDAVESLMQIVTPSTLTTIDMDAFAAAYKRFADSLISITFAVTGIFNDALGNSDSTTIRFLKDIEMDVLVDEMASPVYDCMDERLQTLQSEYASRLQQYQNQLNFLNYYNKHYGLEHKAGVPKGGTFVLVYHPAAATQSNTGSTSSAGTNTGIFTSTSPFTNIGAASGIKTATGINPAISGAKLFTAKAPRRTPDKSKEDKKGSKPAFNAKDTIIRKPIDINTSGTIKTPVTEPVKVAGERPVDTTIPIREQPVITPTKTVTEQPTAVTFPVAEQPIKTAGGEQPVVAATNPVAGQSTGTILAEQPIISSTPPIINQPVNIGTQPVITATNPVLTETIPIATKPIAQQPILVATQPGRIIPQTPATTVSEMPGIPVFTNLPSASVINQQATVNANSLLDENTLSLMNNFANVSANLSSDNKKTILDFLTQAKLQLASNGFNVADNVVIADFYVPYLCCSDCAPVAYIVQPQAPPPAETPQFDITPKEFVFTDDTNYPFTVKPPVTDANKGADPFASDKVMNPGSLHLLTDDNNALFLQPAMPNLTTTLKASVAYQNIPVDITIIKPDASFTIAVVQDEQGNAMLQLAPADESGDDYKWAVNGLDGIFENTKEPASVSIQEIKNKTEKSPFDITLTLSYTRNNKTASDTKQQTYEPTVCIDFESFQLNTVFGPQVGQKEGDTVFVTPEKIVARVFPMIIQRDSGFGVAMIVMAPKSLGGGSQCLQMNTIDMEFDYSDSSLKPTEVTVEFLSRGDLINLSVNESDVFAGQLSQLPDDFKGVKAGIKQTGTGSSQLILKGEISKFRIGGQSLFIDNVCAQ